MPKQISGTEPLLDKKPKAKVNTLFIIAVILIVIVTIVMIVVKSKQATEESKATTPEIVEALPSYDVFK
jgi:hypothetical protein